MTFTLSSDAFAPGERIPERSSRNGENISPPLRWTDAPSASQSFALVLEDPDAPGGVFHHWIVFNISATNDHLIQNVGQVHPELLKQATNDFGNSRYDGPQPPKGPPHRYIFRLIALDVTVLDLPTTGTSVDFWAMVGPHQRGEARLTAVFGGED